jgi:hypothetical protein
VLASGAGLAVEGVHVEGECVSALRAAADAGRVCDAVVTVVAVSVVVVAVVAVSVVRGHSAAACATCQSRHAFRCQWRSLAFASASMVVHGLITLDQHSLLPKGVLIEGDQSKLCFAGGDRAPWDSPVAIALLRYGLSSGQWVQARRWCLHASTKAGRTSGLLLCSVYKTHTGHTQSWFLVLLVSKQAATTTCWSEWNDSEHV